MTRPLATAMRWAVGPGSASCPSMRSRSLGLGRSSLALGRPADARPALEEARATFMRLRAAPALAETETLLAAITM